LKVVADLIRQRVTEATDRGLLLNVWLSDGLDKHVNREARCLANLRLALTAVALEQFRAAHNNRYPAGLSELTSSYLNAVLTDRLMASRCVTGSKTPAMSFIASAGT